MRVVFVHQVLLQSIDLQFIDVIQSIMQNETNGNSHHSAVLSSHPPWFQICYVLSSRIVLPNRSNCVPLTCPCVQPLDNCFPAPLRIWALHHLHLGYVGWNIHTNDDPMRLHQSELCQTIHSLSAWICGKG